MRIIECTYVKKKGKFAVEQATKFQRGAVEAYLYPFFILGARCGWVVNDRLRPLYPWECPCIHNVGGWVGPSDGLDVCGKLRLPPGFDPQQSSHCAILAHNERMYR